VFGGKTTRAITGKIPKRGGEVCHAKEDKQAKKEKRSEWRRKGGGKRENFEQEGGIC